ncbi:MULTISPECIES: hypothetical protein [Parafrankia]|uniref:Uncharacterized protein n=1 Tax=Parafrankia colletiae TaxID=573497 RepID=A0A1S1R136_9ACTN|nr:MULTISPECIES: hypothetical protein [Parafrankia]MCK9905188.1 hypothetical protein [Frankia sp. Cpl3]OHV39647.1 hypothetical protein CC117_33820 [Parafrankia colletiae]
MPTRPQPPLPLPGLPAGVPDVAVRLPAEAVAAAVDLLGRLIAAATGTVLCSTQGSCDDRVR